MRRMRRTRTNFPLRGFSNSTQHFRQKRMLGRRLWMAGSYRRLSEVERVGIMVMLREGLGVRAIGRRLGRPASTISREIARQRQGLSYEAWRAGCRADVLRF